MWETCGEPRPPSWGQPGPSIPRPTCCLTADAWEAQLNQLSLLTSAQPPRWPSDLWEMRNEWCLKLQSWHRVLCSITVAIDNWYSACKAFTDCLVSPLPPLHYPLPSEQNEKLKHSLCSTPASTLSPTAETLPFLAVPACCPVLASWNILLSFQTEIWPLPGIPSEPSINTIVPCHPHNQLPQI